MRTASGELGATANGKLGVTANGKLGRSELVGTNEVDVSFPYNRLDVS
jgi:hypothetical protein